MRSYINKVYVYYIYTVTCEIFMSKVGAQFCVYNVFVLDFQKFFGLKYHIYPNIRHFYI